MFTNTKMRQKVYNYKSAKKNWTHPLLLLSFLVVVLSSMLDLAEIHIIIVLVCSENLNIGDLCQCLFLILKFPRQWGLHLPTSPFEGEPSFSWRPITILCSSELQMGTCKAEGKPAESLPPVLPCQTLPVLYNMISSAYSWIFSFLGFSLRLNSVLQKFFRKIQIYISTMDPRLPCFEVQMDKNWSISRKMGFDLFHLSI